MRSRRLVLATAIAAAAMVLAPAAASALDAPVDVSSQSAGICLESRYLPRDYCIFIDPRG